MEEAHGSEDRETTSAMTRFVPALVTAVITLSSANAAPAQEPAEVPVVALVNVQVVSMDGEGVQRNQTVLIRGDRIAAVGEMNDVRVPEGATTIMGGGRYLLPGLTDAHVHLTTDMPWARTRADFGDAPLYLAYGVTTVINLRGTPTQLEWRRRIEAGELVGPTIYTAGEFVNEPRIESPDDAEREIVAQATDGYDVIKFHEVWTPGQGYVTTVGLSRAAYARMNEAARARGIPLVGHAPVNLGLDAMLEAGQPLAHMGALSNIYFMPMASNQAMLLATAGASLVLFLVVVWSGAWAIIARWSRGEPSTNSPLIRRTRRLGRGLLLVSVLALVSAGVLLPGGLMFDSVVLRVTLTILVAVMVVGTIAATVLAFRGWRTTSTSALLRFEATLIAGAALGLSVTFLLFWVPVSWRSSDSRIEWLAQRVREARISVQTTLINYDSLNAAARSRLIADPAVDYLSPETRSQWRRQQFPALLELVAGRYHEFMRKVVGALHRAGVPLVAGTDAMGVPLVPPGSSLHRELQLLIESGLTPYEAIRTATINPALFLGKEKEFGTIAVGKRADLLLIESNPLESTARLKRPDGVVVRGRWLSRDRLDEMLAAIR